MYEIHRSLYMSRMTEPFRAASDGGGGKSTDAHTKEVLRYREALHHGVRALKKRPLTTDLFFEIVQLIKQTEFQVRAVPGVVLKGRAGKVVDTPPSGQKAIRDKLANLEKFIDAEDDLDPLVKTAGIHDQFEAIHPFPDGNGRTGRILNLLSLVDKGLLDTPVLFLSRFIIANRRGHYEGLRGVTQRKDWETRLLYVLNAVESTAQQTFDQVTRIRAVMEQVSEKGATRVAGGVQQGSDRGDLPAAVRQDPVPGRRRDRRATNRFGISAGAGGSGGAA